MTTTPKPCTMPEEIWAQFTCYDAPLDEVMVDAYDHNFSGGTKYIRTDLVEKMEG